jgi:hypothetical protein
LDTKLVFEGLDLLRHRGLRQQQFLGGSAEIQVPRHGTKNTNTKSFDHGFRLKFLAPNSPLNETTVMPSTTDTCLFGETEEKA